jgi:hypothetical protein
MGWLADITWSSVWRMEAGYQLTRDDLNNIRLDLAVWGDASDPTTAPESKGVIDTWDG